MEASGHKKNYWLVFKIVIWGSAKMTQWLRALRFDTLCPHRAAKPSVILVLGGFNVLF